MAWLHEDQNTFRDAVYFSANQNNVTPAVVEKDYFVTMILHGLANRLPFIVFKGGTSLSKCHKVIRRFSEDIDVTIDTKISQGQMAKVKDAIRDVAASLGLTIPNIDETRSRRSYNRYLFAYPSVTERVSDELYPMVILETSFAEISFPTVVLPVHNMIGDMMTTEAPEMIESFMLQPFEMKVQGIDRTMIDKVFAICDYHLKGDVRRHSRHIYDIYKLLPLVNLDNRFKALVREVREVRAKNVSLCPSAQPGINVPEILAYLLDNEVYKADYENVTSRILEEPLEYSEAITAIRTIIASGVYNENLI